MKILSTGWDSEATGGALKGSYGHYIRTDGDISPVSPILVVAVKEVVVEVLVVVIQ